MGKILRKNGFYLGHSNEKFQELNSLVILKNVVDNLRLKSQVYGELIKSNEQFNCLKMTKILGLYPIKPN